MGQRLPIDLIIQTMLADGQVRLRQQLLQQADKALVQALDARGLEQVQGVVPVAGEHVARPFPGVQGQVELRTAAVQGQEFCVQVSG
ncbi:hypothetical protein PSME7519_06515 [Ectopseudomonas mendocina]